MTKPVGSLQIDNSKLHPVQLAPMASNAKTVNDTVGLNDYTLLLASAQYYFNGINFFSDPTNLMGGFVSSPEIASPGFSCEGVLFRIYGKTAAAGSSLDSKIYIGAGFWDADTNSNTLAMDSITFADLDTTNASNGWNTKLFAAPVDFEAVTRPYAFLDWRASSDVGDTIFGLLFDGDFGELDGLCWVKVGGTWGMYTLMPPYSFFEAWIIADNIAGIPGSDDYFGGIQMTQYPNPSIDGIVTVDYVINKSFNNVTLEIRDLNGKLITSVNDGNKSAGSYTIKLTNKLAAGTYIYSLNADGYRFTKKMIVE
ncbi:MAG: T9SS type A sorting domain-containing protein [Bacteroidales bacterium]|nr:T9SS type A sorting domain-containing protein [Bacteroidales bacterium]MDD4214413.1 T9SS type A sorting domain-containing protein [Bacteroidales bacterium]